MLLIEYVYGIHKLQVFLVAITVTIVSFIMQSNFPATLIIHLCYL